LQAEFKTAKKTKEVSELQQKNLLSEAQLQTRNLQIALSIAMLLVIATAGGLYYSRYQQNKKLNQRLQISNKEKEGLLHEIHHRVKNNLQIISSLIQLKKRQTSASETHEVLHQLNGRIVSMGLLHDKLYQQEDVKSIRLDEYLQEISQQLVSSFDETPYPISLIMNSQPVEIDVNRALTCGLIVNELVTNAIKYAFTPDQKDRKINLNLVQDKGIVELEISDNGRTPKPISGNFNKSFGSRFVDQLVIAKLGGEWSVKLEDGVQIKIKFASKLNGTRENQNSHH
jgi:two-component system, sensor histidine kinase PdtaS